MARARVRVLGPHDGGPVARKGQDGEGAGGQEALVGDGVVGPLVGHGADDPGLRVGPPGDGDGGRVAGLRVAAVGAHHQGGADGPPVGETGPDSPRFPLQVGNAGRGQDAHPVQAAQATGQGDADHPVLHHVAEGPGAGLPVVVMEEQGRGPFADPDMEDGGGVAFHAGPQAQAVKKPPGRERDGRGAAVESGVQDVRRVLVVDDDHVHGDFGQGHGQCGPHHAATDDEHVGLQGTPLGAEPFMGSISLFFGALSSPWGRKRCLNNRQPFHAA